MDREESAQSQDIVRLRSLTSLFERRQTCFGLNTLVIVEIDVLINEEFGLFKCVNFLERDAFGPENREEVFRYSIIITVSSP